MGAGTGWDDWTEIVALINANWPDQQIELPTARVWFAELAEADVELVRQALRNLLRTEDFRPSLAALLREVGRLRASLPPSPSSKIRVDHATFTEILTFDPTARNTPAGVLLSDGSCLPNQTRAERWLERSREEVA